MKKHLIKIVSATLIAALLISGSTSAIASETLSGILPVAGNARVLGEGVSVTALKAEKIKNSRAGGQAVAAKAGAKEFTSDAVIDSVLSQAGDSINISAKTSTGEAAASSQGSKSSSSSIGLTRVSTYTASSSDSTLTKTKTSDPEILTVGGGSTGSTVDVAAMQPVEDEEVSDNAAEDEEESDVDDSELANVTTRKSGSDDDEDFTNLVIAQVNDCVNVRAEASEDSEVIGKLYNNSVGDLIEEAGDWYKIESGSCTGYVKAEYCVTGDEAKELAKQVGTRLARVKTTTLYVRSEPTRDSEVIGMVPMDDELEVLTEMPGWVKVSIEEGDGFVSDEYVKLHTEFVRAESKAEEEARLKREAEAREAARKAAAAAEKKAASKKKNSKTSGGDSGVTYTASGSGAGSSVANYALQFVGNPYVYGGTSLTNGADCSGFVMSVYRNFGVSLPHSSGGDRSVGTAVSGGLAAAQPGDIICYSGHVGIYIGGGQIVHASTARTGIKVSSASYRNVLAVRRIF